MIIIFCSAATAAAALPSWRRPRTALNSGQQEQDDAGAVLLERDDAADAGDEQDDLHRVAVLAHERAPARLRRRLGEPVRPVALETGRGLGRRQPLRGIDLERRGDLVGGEGEPRALGRFRGLRHR